MRIDIIETHIEADARELRESQTLAGNLTALLNQCFRSHEPLDDEGEEKNEVEQDETD